VSMRQVVDVWEFLYQLPFVSSWKGLNRVHDLHLDGR